MSSTSLIGTLLLSSSKSFYRQKFQTHPVVSDVS